MKTKIKTLIFAACFLIFASFIMAQSTDCVDLTFDAVKITPPACTGTELTVEFDLKNLKVTPFSGDVNIIYYIDEVAPDKIIRNTTVNLANLTSATPYNIKATFNGPASAYSLHVQLNVLAPNQECDQANNLFTRNIEPLPFDVGITKIADNHKCSYADPELFPNNGEARAYALINGTETIVGYDFKWFRKEGTNYTEIDPSPGPFYSGMAAGEYIVTATHSAYQCESDTASVVINMVTTNTDNLVVVQENAFTNCSEPNGALRATVYIDNQLQDPSNYYFQWYKSENIGGTVISSIPLADRLLDRSYAVDVTNKKTGCKVTGGATVESEAEIPEITEILVTPMQKNKCNSDPSGSIEVKKATSNKSNNINVVNQLSYRWYYNGEDTLGTTVPGANSYKLGNLVSGKYGVVAILNSNGCPSSLKVAEVTNINKNPDIDFQVINNTSCDETAPNGTFTIVKSSGPTPQITIEKWNVNTSQWQAVLPTFTNWIIPQLNIDEGLYRFFSFHSAGECMDTILTVKDTPVKLDANSIGVTTIPQTNCAGALDTTPFPNGSMSATYKGQTSGFEFYWYKGTGINTPADYSGSNISNVPALDYTLQVIETATKCKSDPVYPKISHMPDLPVITATASPNTSCDESAPNGSITASASSNIAPPPSGYQFQFLDGATAVSNINPYNQANGLAGEKTYSVRATNPLTLCTSTIQQFVGTSDADIPVIDPNGIIVTPNTICQGTGDGSIDATNAVEGDISDYEFQWYDGQGNPIAGTGPVLSGLRDGDYRLGVRKISSSCPSNGTITMTVAPYYQYPIVDLQVSSQQTMCDVSNPNGELTASASMPTGIAEPGAGYSFIWIKNNVEIQTVTTSGESILSGQTMGTYKVQVTNLNTGCVTESPSMSIIDDVIYPNASAVEATSSPNEHCAAPFTGSLVVQNPSDDYTYKWYGPNDIHLGDGTSIGQLNGSLIYRLKVVDNNTLCESQDEKLIEVANQADYPILSATAAPNTSCDINAPNGSIAANATSTIAPPPSGFEFRFFYGAAQITASIDPNNQANSLMGQRTYEVRAFNPTTQCESTIQVVVNNEPDIPIIDITAITTTPNTICVGNPGNGSIDATNAVAGDPADYQFQWFDTQGNQMATTGPVLSNLRDGNYRLGVRKLSSTCPSNGTVNITVAPDYQYPLVNLQATHQQTMCDDINPNGELTATASMPAGIAEPGSGYTFRWVRNNVDLSTVTASNESILSGQPAATFKVVVTNLETGCFAESPSVAIINERVYPNANAVDVISSPNTHCAAPFTGSLQVQDPVNDFTYKWYDPNSVHLGDGSSIGQLNGSLIYRLRVIDNNTLCESQDEKLAEVANQPDLPILTATAAPNTSCDINAPNGSVTANATSTIAPPPSGFEYRFFYGTTQITTNIDPNNQANGLAGQRTYEVRAFNPTTQCESTIQVVVNNEPDIPIIDIAAITTSPNTICVGTPGNGSIDATNAVAGDPADYQFQWFDGQGNQLATTGPVLSNIRDGNYRLGVRKLSSTCPSNGTVNITVAPDYQYPLVDLQATHQQTMCDDSNPNGELTATAAMPTGIAEPGPGYNFRWAKNNVDLTTVTATNESILSGQPAAIFKVIVTNLETGCFTESPSVAIINDRVYPNANAADVISSPNTHCTLPFTGSLEVQDPSDGYTYTWFSQSGTFLSEGSSITALGAGTYQLRVMDNETLCESQNSKLVQVANQPVPVTASIEIINHQTHCNNNVAFHNASLMASVVEPGNFTFEWREGQIATGTVIGSTALITSLTAKYYNVNVTNIETGCKSTVSELVQTRRQYPVVTAVPTPITTCNPFDGTISSSVNNVTAGHTFHWSFGSTGYYQDGLAPGEYSVYAVVDSTECPSPALYVTVEDNVSNNVNITFTDISNPPHCNEGGGQIRIGATNSDFDQFMFEWYYGSNTTPIGSPDGPSVYSLKTGLFSGNYNFKLTNVSNGCVKDTSYYLPWIGESTLVIDNVMNAEFCRPPFNGAIFFSIEFSDEAMAENVTKASFIYRLYEGAFQIGDDLYENLIDFIDDDDPNVILKFEGLPAGKYTLAVMERWSNYGCEEKPMMEEIEIGIDLPEITAAAVLTEDYSCDINNPKGVLTATAASPNPDLDIQGYDFMWYTNANDPGNELNSGMVIGNTSTIENLHGDSTYVVVAMNRLTRCDAETSMLLPKNIRNMVIPASDVVATPQDNCTEGNGTLLVQKITENGLELGIVYDISIATLLDPGNILATSFLNTQITGLLADQYIITAKNPETQCESQLLHSVAVDTISPYIVNTYIFHDQFCAPLHVGNGAVHVAVDETLQGGSAAQTTGYSYEWFLAGDLSTSIHTSHQLTDRPSGEYVVRITDTDGKYRNCASTRAITILENNPNIAITKILTIDQTFCVGDNGQVTVQELMIDGITQTVPAGDYTIQLLEPLPIDGHFFVRNAGTYQFKAIHNIFQCESGIAEATINFAPPVYGVELATVTEDFSCNDNGKGELLATVYQANGTISGTFAYDWNESDGLGIVIAPIDPAKISVDGINSSVTALKGNKFYAVHISNTTDGCEAETLIELPWAERQMIIPLAQVSTTPQDDCLFGNGTLLVKEVRENNLVYHPGILYELLLARASDPATIIQTGEIDVPFTGLVADQYIVTARNTDTECESPQFAHIVGADLVNPAVVGTFIFHDQYCAPLHVGNGAVHVAVDETLQNGSATETTGYSYEWFLASDLLTPIYTSHQLADRPSGEYVVRITDIDGKYRNCTSTKAFTIMENNPNIAITKILTVDQTYCVGDNGQVTVQELMIDGTTQTVPAGDYTIQLLETLPIDGHSFVRNAGTYQFKAIHNTFQCESGVAEATINFAPPLYGVELATVTEDFSCNDNGKGELLATVYRTNGSISGTFTYDWNETTSLGAVVAPIDPAKITVDGTNSSVTALKGNRYYAVHVSNTTDGCEAEALIELPWAERQMIIPLAQVSTTPQDDCLFGNGTLLVKEVRENNLVYHPGILYELLLARASDPATIIQTGEIDVPFTGLTAEQYFITVRNTDTECESPQFAHIVAADLVNPAIVGTFIFHDQYCAPLHVGNGAVHVAVDETLQNGSATETTGYSYEWFLASDLSTPIHTNHQLIDRPSGEYLVRITDTDGKYRNCASTRTFTIMENNPNVVITKISKIDQTDCIGDNGMVTVEEVTINGVAQAIPSGEYTIQLMEATPVEGHSFIRNAGTYGFKAIHNTFGCESGIAEALINFTRPTYRIEFATVKDFSCNENGQGSIAAQLFQDNLPVSADDFTLNWYRGDLTTSFSQESMISGLLSGQYRLNIIDNATAGLGCEHSNFTYLHKEYKRILITGTQTSDMDICLPNGTAAITVIQEYEQNGDVFNGGFNYTYSIKNSNGDILDFTPPTNGTAANPFINLGAGRYTLFAENETTGCESQPMDININDVSTNPLVGLTVEEIQFRKSPPAIPSGEILATIREVDNSTGVYDVQWLFDGATVRNSAGVPGSDLLIEGYSGYYLAIATNQVTHCQGRAEIYLPEEIATPVLAITSDPTQDCYGSGKIFIGSVSIADDPQVISEYTFALYRDFVMPTNKVAEITGTNNVVFDNLTDGIYYVVATHTLDNLTTEPAMIEVEDSSTSPFVLLSNIHHQTRWSSDPSTHNGSLGIMVIKDGGIVVETYNGDYNISWYLGEDQTGTHLPAFENAFNINGLTMGRYTAAVQDVETGCIALASYTIEDRKIPVWVRTDSSPNTMCIGANGVISASDVNPNTPASVEYDYYWYQTGSYPQDNPLYSGQIIEDVEKGTYSVYLVDKDDPDRIGVASVTVADNLLFPTVNISELMPQRNCDTNRPTGSLLAQLPSLNHSDYDVAWYEHHNLHNPIQSGSWGAEKLAAIQYVVRVTHKITGCSGESAPFKVSEDLDKVPLPSNLILSHLTNCVFPNGEITTSVDGATYDYSFRWYFGSRIKNNVDKEGVLIDNMDKGDYTVAAIRESSGCLSGPATSEILDNRLFPILQVKVKNAKCMESTGSANVNILNDAHVGEVIWTDGFRLFYGNKIENMPYGTYHVKVVTEEYCSTDQEVTIDPDIMVYNGISANGDGLNDRFKIGCIDRFHSNQVKIFNRGGDLVYETIYYDNEVNYFDGFGNRGLYLGKKELPIGTYFYIIDLKNDTPPRTGYLELTR